MNKGGKSLTMNKEWWTKFTKEERSYIMWFLKSTKDYPGGSYLPEGSRECGICSTPILGIGPCQSCCKSFNELIQKRGATIPNY